MRWSFGIAPLLVPGVASAGSIGVGAGVGFDLPDVNVAASETTFGPSANLAFPVRFDVARTAAIRATLHAAFSQGQDVVSWQLPGVARVGEPPKRAWIGTVAATVGPEIHVPIEGPVQPYLAAGAGVALVYVWHNLERADLFDPGHYTDEQLDNPTTLDPFSRQPVFATDLALGAEIDRFWFELGYSLQIVGNAPLIRSTPALDVRRETFGWNVVRLVVGFSIPLAGDR